jgi:hypothetical protein
VLVPPAIATVANYMFWTFLCPGLEAGLLFNVCRGAIAAWAGWRIVTSGAGSLGVAALAGALPFLIDQVVIKAGYFLVRATLVGVPERHQFLLAFAGVCVSYLMFVVFPMAIALFGSVAARVRKGDHRAPA